MSKQLNRGFYTHGFNFECLNCCCSVCTGRLCPYTKTWGIYRYKCAQCVKNAKCVKCLECDFFENKYTVPRHFKIKFRGRKKGEIEKRLDAIMEKLGVELPEDKK